VSIARDRLDVSERRRRVPAAIEERKFMSARQRRRHKVTPNKPRPTDN
jgi:hypothetical protein